MTLRAGRCDAGPELAHDAELFLRRLDRQADAAMSAPLPETTVLTPPKGAPMLRRLLGYKPPPGPAGPKSPLVTLAVDVVLSGKGLVPGARYDATFQTWGKYQRTPHLSGHSTVVVNSRGEVRVEVDLEDLRQYRPNVRLLRVWLRPPGSRADAPPVEDAEGRLLWAERRFEGVY